MTEPLVEVHSLTKNFSTEDGSSSNVLNDIDCRIFERDRIALIGPSGSGKSTLLHLLGGLDVPSEGAVTWPALGEREDLRPRKVSLVFQFPSLFPALTVIQNVALPLILAGDKADAFARSMVLLESFGLDELADKLPEEISGGQAQRVSMVRAIVPDPRLILADEPTGQLDSVTAQDLIDRLLDHITARKSALLIATHDQSIASHMSLRWDLDHGTLSSAPGNGTTP
jgi:ABC-type lipoprotein export system ATPase subunit